MAIIKPITLAIEEKDWITFCNKIPDTRTKNGTLVELIRKFNGEK
jgi:hypothetical protein